MDVKAKETWEKIKAFFTNMEKGTRKMLLTALIVIVAGAIVIAVVLNNAPYTALFTGLSAEETRAIASYLDSAGVSDYRIEGTDTVLVRKTQEDRLKAALLVEGYPKTGYAYETYKSMLGVMSTESDRTAAMLFDLQDRIASVIRHMDGVQEAVVFITQEEDQRYILDSTAVTQATASVMVTMRGGVKLSTQSATAIQNLVSKAVKGLEITNVSIVDSNGNSYTVTGDLSADTQAASSLKLQVEEQISNSVRTQIMTVLAPIFGTENVRVAVYSEVDVSHTVSESTQYHEPPWAEDGSSDGRGIVGSETYDRELIRDPEDVAGGVVGTQSNADINTYVEDNIQVNGSEKYILSGADINYNVSNDREQQERVVPVLKDLSVSVTINSEVAAGTNNLALVDHVARAAGISTELQGEKINILFAPFMKDSTAPIGGEEGTVPAWALYAAIGGVALLLLLLIVFTILRRRRRKKKTKELEAMLDSSGAFDEPVRQEPKGADLMNIKTEKSLELRKDIRQFAEENPEIAAQMLRSWLRGGEVDA